MWRCSQASVRRQPLCSPWWSELLLLKGQIQVLHENHKGASSLSDLKPLAAWDKQAYALEHEHFLDVSDFPFS